MDTFKIKTLYKFSDPKILLITPLKTGAKVSKETKKTIKRNTVPFVWISYEGDNNPAKNTQYAWDIYKKEFKTPPFIMKLDNDIISNRGMLDKMYKALLNSDKNAAYAYCGFEFQGNIQLKFPLRPFNPAALMKGNYISFNSLIRTEALESIGGFVTEDKYFRLLDWALWLKFLRYGFYGIPVEDTHFIAISSKDSVSSGSQADYKVKASNVIRDFVDPIRQA